MLSPRSECRLITGDYQVLVKKNNKKNSKKNSARVPPVDFGVNVHIENLLVNMCATSHAGKLSHRRAFIDKTSRGVHTVLEDYLWSSEIIISN